MVGPDPALARVRQAVREHLEHRRASGALADGDLVLVACSGGPDSVALASQTAFLARRLRLRAGAVVVDHGLGPNSADRAAAAARTCTELGLDPVIVRRVPAARATETAAREARRAALADAVADTGAVGVLLGHTLDDQAEGVLLALARGSGARSLAAMATVAGRSWRPLLGVRRRDTHATCAVLGLAVEHDPSNRADGPWRRADSGPVPRAAVRDRVLPALADALGQDPAPALARTAALARADADLLERLAEQAYGRCAAAVGEGEVGLEVVALAAEHDALRTRVLRRAALAAGAPAAALQRAHVEAMDALVTRWRGQGEVPLPGGVVAVRDCGRLVLAQRRPSPETSHRAPGA